MRKQNAQAIVPQFAAQATHVSSILNTVKRLNDVRKFILKALKPEVDYGTIPGVDRKFLLQPGAEKIAMWLSVFPKYETKEFELGDGHIDVVSVCTLKSIFNGQDIFQSPACSCSTMESNYRYRWVKADDEERPSKQKADELKALGVGKWKKEKDKDGALYWVWLNRRDNPNIHDTRNTVRQMAAKRAMVKAIRGLGAMSEIFTEDPEGWEMLSEDTTPESEAQSGERKIVRDENALILESGVSVVWPPSHNGNYALFFGDSKAFTEPIVDYIKEGCKGKFTDAFGGRGGYLVPHLHVDELRASLERDGHKVRMQPLETARRSGNHA